MTSLAVFVPPVPLLHLYAFEISKLVKQACGIHSKYQRFRIFMDIEGQKATCMESGELAILQHGRVNQECRSKENVVLTAVKKLHKIALKGQIAHMQKLSARLPDYAESKYMPLKLKEIWKKQGITNLYSHQVEAIDIIFEGSNVVAATPTASGKSLIFTTPVLEALMTNPKSRALFIFPLKALARDQLAALRSVVSMVAKRDHCYSYDGDTAEADRAHIRKHGQIVLTNPDMLHQGILPNHKQWTHFFKELKFVVIDEAHVYRGVFGSHVGCILRRLLRIARYHKAEPMFITCSATIANPQEHVKRLTSMDVEVINGSGAPSGEKHIICWQPPELDHGDGKRRSSYQEAADIVVELVTAGVQTLCFVEARKLTEIVTSSIHEKLKKQHKEHLIEKVDSYRAGYSVDDRQKLEKDLQSGTLRALVTTNALELGIDVGALDATVHVGVSSSVSSMWQQIGRAGRRLCPSLAVLVALERPLDQYYMKCPEKLFERHVESAFCNPTNPYVLRLHLPCAARELPLTDEDRDLFDGTPFELVRDELAEEATLLYEEGTMGGQYRYRWADSPAVSVSIRGVSPNPYQLVDSHGALIEEIEAKMAFRRIHPGAIFLHRRETYEIVSLDIEHRKAVARTSQPNFITEVKENIDVKILREVGHARVLCGSACWGKLQVREQVCSYSKKNLLTDKVVMETPLQLPPNEFDTTGMWWNIPQDALDRLHQDGVLYDAMLALKRLALALLPSFTMCDQTDMNSLAVMTHEQTGQPQIFIYDVYPGGVGITQQAFPRLGMLWEQALQVVRTCQCQGGCPGCVQDGHLDTREAGYGTAKKACRTLLEGLTGAWMSSERAATGTTEQKRPGSVPTTLQPGFEPAASGPALADCEAVCNGDPPRTSSGSLIQSHAETGLRGGFQRQGDYEPLLPSPFLYCETPALVASSQDGWGNGPSTAETLTSHADSSSETTQIMRRRNMCPSSSLMQGTPRRFGTKLEASATASLRRQVGLQQQPWLPCQEASISPIPKMALRDHAANRSPEFSFSAASDTMTSSKDVSVARNSQTAQLGRDWALSSTVTGLQHVPSQAVSSKFQQVKGNLVGSSLSPHVLSQAKSKLRDSSAHQEGKPKRDGHAHGTSDTPLQEPQLHQPCDLETLDKRKCADEGRGNADELPTKRGKRRQQHKHQKQAASNQECAKDTPINPFQAFSLSQVRHQPGQSK